MLKKAECREIIRNASPSEEYGASEAITWSDKATGMRCHASGAGGSVVIEMPRAHPWFGKNLHSAPEIGQAYPILTGSLASCGVSERVLGFGPSSPGSDTWLLRVQFEMETDHGADEEVLVATELANRLRLIQLQASDCAISHTEIRPYLADEDKEVRLIAIALASRLEA